ncbi:AMP-binding protein [Leekyejoonella antrihumi]|uniref:AMP-binding protein n=1 Tax=Leekyejoonella antrihumi TaxID=1660198 RepID=UPI001C96A77C|nr:AMP-binding protein [Leekyejoonella antrihumi]
MDFGIGSWLTYLQLEARTNALADALRRHGVRPGDRVATLTLNSPQMLEILFAVAKLGAICVPINFRLSASEVHYILAPSGASVVFESSSLTCTVSAAPLSTSAHSACTLCPSPTSAPAA